MAQIKRFARESPISNFQTGAPTGGGAFSALADGLNAIYDRVAPVAIDQMKVEGEALGRAAAKAQLGSNRPYQAKPKVAGGAGDGAVSGGAGGDWLQYANQGAIRSKPLNDKLVSAMSFLPEMGVTMKVVSGGQDGKGQGGKRTGSTRHDHGNAADADFYKDGRKLVSGNPEDEAILAQIVSRARANGVTGFGEGADYMGAGRLHLGYGAEAVWGAGGKGANAPEWLRNAVSVGPPVSGKSGTDTLAGGAAEDGLGDPVVTEPATLVRTASGNLESRLYSPYSGPILQAHNAAAQIGYQAEVLNKAAVDLMDMANQFPLDPEGFNTTARGYVDELVSNAPESLQPDLRRTLEADVQRRQFGMMEEKQRDIRTRASNSSAALVDRWSDTYAEALVTGDPDEVQRARAALDGVLQAREALPGVGWTAEQSANVFIDAGRRAERAAQQQQKAQSAEWKDRLNTIAKAAKAGLHASGEDIIDDPEVIAAHPELAREVAALTTFRDMAPDFNRLPLADQAAQVAEIQSQEVVEDWQVDFAKAAADLAKENRKGWEDDGVSQAAKVFPENPPPVINFEVVAEDPEALVAAMADRRGHMLMIRDAGFTDTAVFLSNDEIDALSVLMSAETPPEVRAALSAAITAGFGDDAIPVFDEIDADPVTMFAGKMSALGGDPALAAQMILGQQKINDGLVRVPSKGKRVDAIDDKIGQAFVGVPDGDNAQTEIVEAAQALYGADPTAPGLEPTSQAAEDLFAKKLNMALGQTTKRGVVRGGVQEIMGHQVLLPPSVSGARVQEVMREAAGAGRVGFWEAITRGPGSMAGQGSPEIWDAIGGPPLHNGKPIPADRFMDSVRLVPVMGNKYRMEVISDGSRVRAAAADGLDYVFDIQELLDAAQ